MMKSLGGWWLLVALATPVAAAPVEGQVLRVIDGDSLIVQTAPDATPLEVRLEGIDAPEGCQAGGPAARDALAAFVQEKTVSLAIKGHDHYGRTLATVSVDGLNVNLRMVAEGQAWSLRTRWDYGPYVKQERMALALKRGLHATPGAVLPADFRRRNGPCKGPPTASGPGAAPASAPTPAPTSQAPAPVPLLADAGASRCDGRTYCSQMRSCEEATYFLQHCPGVKMDGDHDGVPCERQWCR